MLNRRAIPLSCRFPWLAALAIGLGAQGQSFTPGNLAVLRVGDGAQTLVNSGNTLFLDQYGMDGSLVNTVTIPDSGTSALLLSGTASSEGGMTRSLDRTVLALAGYNTNRGTVFGSLASQAGTAVARGIATIDAFGSNALVQTSTSVYSGNNIRCGTADGTNNYWAAGANSGTCYFNPPNPPINNQNAIANTRYIKAINGNLYFSTQAGTAGIYTFQGGGLPKSSATIGLLFATGSGSSAAAFDINPSVTVAYVADARTTTSGGIQKWTSDGGSWTLAYTLGTGTGTGAFGVVADFSGATPVIYATTTEASSNRLVRIVDTNAFALATLLATAGSNRYFRAVDFVPDLRPIILTQPESQEVTNGSAVSFMASGSSVYPFSYQWQKNGTNIDGAIASTLTLTNVTTEDQGTYHLIVTNLYGSATSADATLTVNVALIAPTITTQPGNQTNFIGGGATFTVTASGSAPLHYQWQFNAGDITGQTDATFSLTCVSATNQGNYRVRVFNAAGSTNSREAALTVIIPAASAIAYTSPGTVYTQAFDLLPNPGADSVNAANPVGINGVTYALANPFDLAFPPSPCIALPGGLGLSERLAGWYGLANGNAQFGASAGDQSTGGVISFGLTNSPAASIDRALGLLATSSSGGTAFGAKFINQTTNILNQISLSFTGELWRQSAAPKTLAVSYWIDPTATNTFSANLTVALADLNMSFPTDPAITAPVPMDGTASSNQVSLGVINQPIASWPPGAALWLVWRMNDATGQGQGLAIDDLSFSASSASPFRLEAFGREGLLQWTGAPAPGICTVQTATQPAGPWTNGPNAFATNSAGRLAVPLDSGTGFYRLLAADISATPQGFTNLVRAYGILETIAGNGAGRVDSNSYWSVAYEGGPATSAALSRPHFAMADRAGNIFIADKSSHAVLKVAPDGTIHTHAGTHLGGFNGEGPAAATALQLNYPNGLWVRSDGTVYVLDTDNGRVRHVSTNGLMTTLFLATPDGSPLSTGRGLWINDNESLAYFCAGTRLRSWTPSGGAITLASGFSELGTLFVEASGDLIVCDRGANYVYRVHPDGSAVIVAGNGGTSGGGDGWPALATGLYGVRSPWPVPTGGFLFLAHDGCQLWYLDTAGTIHLLLNGASGPTHSGDGAFFYDPSIPKIGEGRGVSMDYEGNILVCESDYGYIRRIRFERMLASH